MHDVLSHLPAHMTINIYYKTRPEQEKPQHRMDGGDEGEKGTEWREERGEMLRESSRSDDPVSG
jgi:hypothetical protein